MKAIACVLGALTFAACASPDLEFRRVPVADGVIFAELAGDGDTVILIHGGQLDRRVWDEQFGALADVARVVRYDVRGYGLSDDPVAAYASHDDLVQLMDGLGIERAHVVGFSLGGRIAIDAALVAPERIESLLLVGPGISGWPWSDEDLRTFGAIRETASGGRLDEATEAWLAHPWMQPAMEDERRAERVRAIALENARCWTHTAPEVPLDPPALERLAEVAVPVRVVVGDRDLESIHAITAEIAAKVPGATIRAVEDCGHVVPMERPGVMLREIVSVLESSAHESP